MFGAPGTQARPQKSAESHHSSVTSAELSGQVPDAELNPIPFAIPKAIKDGNPFTATSIRHLRRSQLAQRTLPRVALKSKGRIVFISLADVVAVEARGNYVLVQLETSSYLLRDSISAIANKFECYGFVRIHRSVVINGMYVREVQPQQSGDYLVRTCVGRREYLVTRTYRKNLTSLAEVWVGTTSVSEASEAV